MVQGNGMDLSVFQFDYDMSFAVFFLDSDKTIYGRYGSRTQSGEGKADSEISMKGLAASMKAALALHSNKAKYAAVLRLKTGPAPKYATPEKNPQLRKYKPKIDYGPNVAKSCVHCHQVRDVERLVLRKKGMPLPDRVLFPYPMPDALGLRFDKDSRATVADVIPSSAAATAGIRRGDKLRSLQGQPITSVADIQWVLENTLERGDELMAVVEKVGGGSASVKLRLEEGWRRKGDISWRVSTWDLRRIALGGMKLDQLEDRERKRLGLEGKMALLAKHVGQYNDHAVAKRAGVVKGDILIEFDGVSEDLSEAGVIAHGMQKRKAGDVVPVKMLRRGKEMSFRIKLQ